MGSTDLELLSRYADARDAEAFAELVARHRGMVYAACYRVLASRADAEDSTQECFLRLARNSQSVTTSVVGWLHRVALHTSMDAQRRDRTRKKTEREAASMLADGSAERSWDEIKTEIDQAIDGLPDELRDPLLRCFLEGTPQRAVADELGLSQPAVSIRIKKGIEQLRRHLKEAGLTVSAAGLAGLLTEHAVEAAPATLVASLGKIALAGIGTSPAPIGAGGAGLGIGLVASSQAKIACIVAAAVAVGAVVQQTIRRPGIAREAVTTAQDAGVTGPVEGTDEVSTIAAPAPETDEPENIASAEARATVQPEAEPAAEVNVRPGVPEEVQEPPSAAEPAPALEPVVQAPPEEPAIPDPYVLDPAAGAPTALAFQLLRTDPRAPVLQAIERPGVKLLSHEAVDPTYPEPIADVVSVAKQALEALFPDGAKDWIRVRVLPRSTWVADIVTDRRDTIHVGVSSEGLGELLRADAGPMGMLCQAVAELYNPQRVPGFDRFVTHAYLVPAVIDALGPDVVPSVHPTALAEDGSPMLETITDPAYASVHPDFAAVAALVAIEERLGLEELLALLEAIPEAADDPFAVLRQAAIEKAAELAGAFTEYDEANTLEPEEDGTYLVASFEPDEVLTQIWTHPLHIITDNAVFLAPGVDISQSDEWATHGTHSLALTTRDVDWIGLHFLDPDWRFKDWRRFSKLELDLMVVADHQQGVTISLSDHMTDAGRWVPLFSDTLAPFEERHIACRLGPDTLGGAKSPFARYFGGPFRADEVCRLGLNFGGAKRPTTVYVDNIRLTPRGEGDEEWARGAELVLAPTGVITMADDDGPIGTLWLTALGTEWTYGTQRGATAMFIEGNEPGSILFTGEMPVPRTDGARVLFEQSVSPLDAGIDLQYDMLFSEEMTLNGLNAALRVPFARFRGGSVVIHQAEDVSETVELGEQGNDPEQWQLHATHGVKVELLSDAGSVLTIGIDEPGLVPIAVQDVRRWGTDEYEISFIFINTGEGHSVWPDEDYTLKVHLDFPGGVTVVGP